MAWPDLGKNLSVVQGSTLHHEPNLGRIPNVLEWIAAEYLKIGEFAGFKAAEVPRVTNRRGTHDRG